MGPRGAFRERHPLAGLAGGGRDDAMVEAYAGASALRFTHDETAGSLGRDVRAARVTVRREKDAVGNRRCDRRRERAVQPDGRGAADELGCPGIFNGRGCYFRRKGLTNVLPRGRRP